MRTNFEESITILDQIMTTEIPTIWLELKEANQRKTAIGGFYREWTHEGTKTVEEQLKNIELLNRQIETITSKYNNSIILGDANICSEKWDDPNFGNKTVSEALRSTLTESGLTPRKLGNTFIADKQGENGNVISSAIDHIYVSADMENRTATSKINHSSSDHLPIIANIKLKEPKINRSKTITKR